ncbi:hypothetical protein GQ42DRAFT_163220 [Ramicandelaber brevisporus]|nr:hypothetical protein GQ42DRAFT_163725 [Ramicandelaber brevisporus]KAI8869747.1 hypothetical protein GQ42DRAFT_163220 [Ramicandelaber brevisporus]
MVRVRQIAEMGADVELLEYGNIEGMILLSELSRRRIRSVHKLIKAGAIEVALVLRVDKEKGYIDLSKRQVTPEDMTKCEERFNRAKVVHGILAQVAKKQDVSLTSLYETIGWPLYKKFGHAYLGFQQALDQPEKVFEGISMTDGVRTELMSNIARKLTPQPVKIRADIVVGCNSYEGIDAIKKALRAGLACSIESAPLSIKLIKPPYYVMSTTTTNKEGALTMMNEAITAIEKGISAESGEFLVKMRPKVVGESEEKELEERMLDAERQAREVPADDDLSDRD